MVYGLYKCFSSPIHKINEVHVIGMHWDHERDFRLNHYYVGGISGVNAPVYGNEDINIKMIIYNLWSPIHSPL